MRHVAVHCKFATAFLQIGVGDLVRINGVVYAEKYRQILMYPAIPSGRRVMAPHLFCSRTTTPPKKPMQPPQSPDLNIMECIWDYMKRHKDFRKPTSTEDL